MGARGPNSRLAGNLEIPSLWERSLCHPCLYSKISSRSLAFLDPDSSRLIVETLGDAQDIKRPKERGVNIQGA